MGRPTRSNRSRLPPYDDPRRHLPDDDDEEMHPARVRGIEAGEEYAEMHSERGGMKLNDDDGPFAVGDAITALMHYAHDRGWHVESIVSRAEDHFDYEINNPEG